MTFGGGGLLDVVTAAIAPVVLISASAILLGTVNAKHTALSDRVRALAVEYRDPRSSPERRLAIQAQSCYFRRRIGLVGGAHTALFASVASFVAMVLLLALTPRGHPWDVPALGCFVVGALLILLASGLELAELGLARRTLDLEIADVLAPAEAPTGGVGG